MSGAAHDAVQCVLYAQTSGSLGVLSTAAKRTLTVRRTERGSVDLAPLVMTAALDQAAFGVWVRHGDQQIFRGLYQFGATLPENRFLGEHGFTGLIYLEVPGAPASYQLICSAVSSGPDPDRGNRRAVQRERDNAERIAKLVAALNARDSLVPARAAALLELHELRQRQFPNLQLAGAALDGADLRESQMPDANFAGASLEQASLYFNNLVRSDFSRANLQRANLYSVELAEAHLREANLRGASLERAELQKANLVSADLTGAYLAYAVLSGADLTNANLEHANLEGADLRDANLTGANLRGAQLKGAKLQGAQLGDARNLTPQQRSQAEHE